MRVVFYSLEGCSYCERVRRALESEGAPFHEVNLTREPQAITELLKLTKGRRVVPVLVQSGQIRIAPEGGTSF